MKICKWDSKKNPDDDSGQMVVVTRKEAFQIIRSISHQLEQLETGLDTNDVRLEFFPNDGEYGYFSIAVNEDPDAIFRGKCVHR